MKSEKSILIRMVCLVVTTVAFGAGATDLVKVGLYGPSQPIARLSRVFEAADFSVQILSGNELDQFCKDSRNVLVVAPGSFPEAAKDLRITLDKLLRGSGNLMLLSSGAVSPGQFDQAVSTSERRIEMALDFSDETTYRLVKDPQSKLITRSCDVPGRGKVLSVRTANLLKDKIGGGLMVDFPVTLHASPDRLEFEIEAKGAVELDILTVRVVDSFGNIWVGFYELTSEWQVCRIPFADLLPVGSNTQSILEVDPSHISKVQVGLDAKTLWGEAGGSMVIGTTKLVDSGFSHKALSGQVVRHRTQFKQVGANYPEWVFDPFAGGRQVSIKAARFSDQAFALKGDLSLKTPAVFLPEFYYEAGGNPESYIDQVGRRAARRIPLIEAESSTKSTGDLARLDVYSAGNYRGAAVALFSLTEEDYGNGQIGELLRRTALYMAHNPRIIDAFPSTTASSGARGADFTYRVQIYNPQSSVVAGMLDLKLADGLMSAHAQSALAPQQVSEVVLSCGIVPAEFPFTSFDLSLTLQSESGRDEIYERIDVERTLCSAADQLIDLQSANFTDAAYTHWFYSDAYAARMLRALGAHTGRRSYRDSAMRWALLMAGGQRDNGMFPMGYGMKEGSYYIADNGSIALALAQIASYASTYEKEIFLEADRRYFEWRKTFRVTPDRAVQLRAEYGADTDGATLGFYGIGYIRFDYLTGKTLDNEFARPEYRGVWYTLACSMGVSPALARLTDSSEYRSAATADAQTYLDNKMSATHSYAPEGLVWLYAYLEDEPTRSALKNELTRNFISYFETAPERFWLKEGSRQTLLLSPLVYSVNKIENSPRTRSALLGMVTGLCAEFSPYSMLRVARDCHKGAFSKVSNEMTMYLSFGSFGLMELLVPGSTLLREDVCAKPTVPLAGASGIVK